MRFLIMQCIAAGFLIFGLACALFPRRMQELDIWLSGLTPWAPNPFAGWKKTPGFVRYVRVTGWIITVVCLAVEILIFAIRSL